MQRKKGKTKGGPDGGSQNKSKRPNAINRQTALDRLRTEPIPLSSPAASADAPEEPQFDSEELRSRFRQFELLILVYSALHLGAQHLMLYGNHFYEYNFNVCILSFLLLSRRILVDIYDCPERYLSEEILTRARSVPRFVYPLVSAMLLGVLVRKTFEELGVMKFLLLFFVPFVLHFYINHLSGREDNMSVKTGHAWVFRGLELVYLSTVLPFMSVQFKSIHIVAKDVSLITVFSILNSCIILVSEHLWTYHRSYRIRAHNLLGWESHRTSANVREWTPSSRYKRGSVVSHRGRAYIAVGEQNCAQPGAIWDGLFILMFSAPDVTHSFLSASSFFVAFAAFMCSLISDFWFPYSMIVLGNAGLLFWLRELHSCYL